ncbi:mite allergen Der f 3-like [Bacillus rossius redtenbacheri]|uniref:mite allergen Der f 3-like n=1 Tax=Bacillus rossius redtenbacheri TaxID=93214 RepID=UPI002FDC95CA
MRTHALAHFMCTVASWGWTTGYLHSGAVGSWGADSHALPWERQEHSACTRLTLQLAAMKKPAVACFARVFVCVAVLLATVDSARLPYEKIIGGGFASDGEFPYQLSMETHSDDEYMGFCGASAISDVWALSAAHCVFEGYRQLIPAETTVLRAGSLKRAAEGSVHQVELIVPHYKYDSERYDCDIAVLKVKNPFSANKYVTYPRLPYQGQKVKVGTKLTVIGWGLVNDMEPSEDLKKTEIDVVDERVCEDIPHFRQVFQITKDMICAVAEGTDSAPVSSLCPTTHSHTRLARSSRSPRT